MTRRLIDYKKLDHTLAALLLEQYPYGYGDEDIIVFKNQHGEYVEAVELKTADTLYLIKISKSLSNFIANFEDNIKKELEEEEPEELPLPTLLDEDGEADLQLDWDSESGMELDTL
jgi:hypothetical protein